MPNQIDLTGYPEMPIPLEEQMTWTEELPDLIYKAQGKFSYTAINFTRERSDVPDFPWYLRRNDGLFARVTNFPRLKDLAELWERGWLGNAGFEKR